MVRTIEVSHWGNVAIEETFHVKHTGAELKVILRTHFVIAGIEYCGFKKKSPFVQI
jgi:hypothetical protein